MFLTVAMLKSIVVPILYLMNLAVQVFTLLLEFSHCPSSTEEGDLVTVMQIGKEKCSLYLKSGH